MQAQREGEIKKKNKTNARFIKDEAKPVFRSPNNGAGGYLITVSGKKNGFIFALVVYS